MSGRVEIGWLLPDGRGGGRDGERIVRVPGALPGDVVAYEPLGSGGDARLVEILTPSPDRRSPPCPWDARCGGCDLAALAPAARPDVLRRTIAWATSSLSGGREGADTLPDWVPSPRATGHRARIKLAIDGDRLGYRAERSHELVEIGDCAIARDEVRAAIARLRETGAHRGFDAVELRSDGERVVYAFTRDRHASGSGSREPQARGSGSRDRHARGSGSREPHARGSGSREPQARGGIDRAALAALGDVAVDGKAVVGDPRLTLNVDGIALRASPRSFYQVNLEVNARLVAWVRDAVVGVRAERVLDLYAGIGNLSLPMAKAGVPVAAVELEGQAIADLRASAAGYPVEAIGADVARFDPSRTPFDAAVLDPPRAGAPGVLGRLLRQRPRAIVYVSCHLPSAIRDLREVTRSGYTVTRVCGFDMFPDTHHFETALLLERG